MTPINRRQTLLRTFGAMAAVAGAPFARAAGMGAVAGRTYEITHTEAEWKARLTSDEYLILREGATERAHTSALADETASGIYHCAGCNLPLYFSEKKFYSPTGWPSFWAPIPQAIDEVRDDSLGMLRTGISCQRCGSHIGHVFNDGPQPTGLRYCMNGLSLKFERTA